MEMTMKVYNVLSYRNNWDLLKQIIHQKAMRDSLFLITILTKERFFKMCHLQFLKDLRCYSNAFLQSYVAL